MERPGNNRIGYRRRPEWHLAPNPGWCDHLPPVTRPPGASSAPPRQSADDGGTIARLEGTPGPGRQLSRNGLVRGGFWDVTCGRFVLTATPPTQLCYGPVGPSYASLPTRG